LGLVYVRCWFCIANYSCNGVFAPVHGLSVFVWYSYMYVVGFAPLIILAIVFCLGALTYVFIWDSCMYVVGFAQLINLAIVFCTGALTYVFIWDSCMYVVGFAPQIILAMEFLHRCMIYLCSFGTPVCTLLVLQR
jgi:hypothetical protein